MTTHHCPLPDNAEDTQYWRCPHCGKPWIWLDVNRIGADFNSGWTPL